MIDSVGDIIDRRYHLRREIARSELGVVFEAEHLVTGRIVAMKRLLPRALETPYRRQMLAREARILTALRAPSFVEVLDGGDAPPGMPYLAMELLAGRNLEGLLAVRRTLPVEVAGLVGVAAAEALAFAHARGVVHRNVKPSNLFLPTQRPDTDAPAAKLLDFGLALYAARRDGAPPFIAEDDGDPVGTPEYMAPEQLFGEKVDARADLYALGVTLFEMLTGDVPFTGAFEDVLAHVSSADRAPSARERRSDVPAAVDAVVSRALSRSPADRFPDAASLASALSKALAGAPKSDAPPAQRRRAPRVSYVTPVRLLRPDGATLDGRSEDISEGGMLVLAPAVIGDSERVEVRFALPVTQNIVKLRASARWITSARNGKGAIGLEFDGVEEDVRRTIARYVELMAPSS